MVRLGAWPAHGAAFPRPRDKSQSEDLDLPKINAELFAKIRTDKDGPEFDDATMPRPGWSSAASNAAPL